MKLSAFTLKGTCSIATFLLFTAGPLTAKEGNGNQHANVPSTPRTNLPMKKQVVQTNMQAGRSLCFLENKGQVTDQNGKERPDIQFQLKTAGGLNIFVGSGAIHYQFSRCENPEALLHHDKDEHSNIIPQEATPITFDMYRMDVELVGANKNARFIAERPGDYYENYYTGATSENGVTVYSWQRIIYKDIYPFIDWVLYIKGDRLEHEFLVHKGGKVSDIQLKYSGASNLKLNNDGSLAASTPQGTITEDAPRTYQRDGGEVSSAYKLTGDVVSYVAGAWTGELVIDPGILWSTYYGGGGDDQGLGVATDGSGSVYITGQTGSISGIATSGAHQVTRSSTVDAFLAKFSSTGVQQWATYYGGSGNDIGKGVATDCSGNVYIVGTTNGASGIATIGAYQTAIGGGSDAFLTKFTSAGTRLWATYYGNSGGESGLGVVTEGSENVYITGSAQSTSGIATGGAYQTAFGGGGGDAFLTKFTSAGVRLWATYYGGTGLDQANSVAIDVSGNVYIAGYAGSTSGIASGGAHQTAYGGGTWDAFLAKFSGTGVRQWGTYYGGSGLDVGYGVATDGSGNVYFTGQTSSASGITTSGAHQTAYGGGTYDALLAKFSSTGVRQWGTYYGASGLDIANGVATDGSGNVYFTGQTSSASGITTSGAYQTAFGGGVNDAFLTQFSNAGALQWGTYYGGSGTEVIATAGVVVADGMGNVYITGYTASSSGISTTGAHQTTFGGSNDVFLAAFQFFTNNVPSFPGCGTHNLNLCQNATAAMIDSLLQINDADAGQTETWTIISSPTHGTLSGVASYTATSTGSTITPAGMTYTPTTGYNGTDAFTVQVSDGIATATTVINVTVNALPSVSAGSSVAICSGSATLTASGGTTYTWSPPATLAASTGSSVTATPTVTTTYTVTGSNGTCSNTATKTVSVNAVNPLTGTLTLSTGGTTTLSSTTTGGLWTSVSVGVATVGSSSGIVNGVSAGTSLISYTAGGCSATATVTVSGLPALVYYSSTPGGDASDLTNWWSNNNNTGSHPSSFSTTNTTWVLQSNMTSTVPLTFAGNISIIAGGVFTPLAASTTTVGGNWRNIGGAFIHNGGTVLFDGANGVAADTVSGGAGGLTGTNAFNNLTFGSSSATYTFLGNAADVNGVFLQSGGTVTAPSSNLNVGGDFTHIGGNFAPNGGTLTMVGNSSTMTVTGMTTPTTNCLNNLSFNAAMASTYTINADLLLMGSFAGLTTNSTMNLGNHTLTVGKNWSNLGHFTQGAGHRIIYNHSGPVTITGSQ